MLPDGDFARVVHRQSTRSTLSAATMRRLIARGLPPLGYLSSRASVFGRRTTFFDFQDDSLFRVNRPRNAFDGRGINFLQPRNQRDLAKTRLCSFQTVFKVAPLALGKGKVFDLQ